MNKKWLYLCILLIVVTIVGVRIYQVNANAFAYEDSIHPIKEHFETKGYSFQVNKVDEMSESQIKKKKATIPNLFIEPSDTILSVKITVKKVEKTNRLFVPNRFQLNKGPFVKYADNKLVQVKNKTEYTLNFIVPKEIVQLKEPFYLAPPPNMWGKEKRDLIRFDF